MGRVVHGKTAAFQVVLLNSSVKELKNVVLFYCG